MKNYYIVWERVPKTCRRDGKKNLPPFSFPFKSGTNKIYRFMLIIIFLIVKITPAYGCTGVVERAQNMSRVITW